MRAKGAERERFCGKGIPLGQQLAIQLLYELWVVAVLSSLKAQCVLD